MNTARNPPICNRPLMTGPRGRAPSGGRREGGRWPREGHQSARLCWQSLCRASTGTLRNSQVAFAAAYPMGWLVNPSDLSLQSHRAHRALVQSELNTI